MVEAGGVGIFKRIENTQLTEKSRRQKRSILGNCAQLERIWNAGISPYWDFLQGKDKGGFSLPLLRSELTCCC